MGRRRSILRPRRGWRCPRRRRATRTGGAVLVATNSPNHQRGSIDLLVLGDVEVHQLVGSLAAGDHTDVVTEVLLLQVLLGEVLGREGSS